MTGQFDNAVVLITGAGGGIGRVLCAHFAAAGARVGALDREIAAADAAVADLPESSAPALSVEADVADADAVAAAVETVQARLGPVSVLVNNAGFVVSATLTATTPKTWERDVAGNLSGAYHCVHTVLPGMRAAGRGAIVTIGSVNGLQALGHPAYSAAKAGLISLTRSLAVEFGRDGIRANLVCPGTVRTPVWDERVARRPEIFDQLRRWYPLGRIVEPEDVANAVVFLASDTASAITGVVLPVDCGLMAGNAPMAAELTLEDS